MLTALFALSALYWLALALMALKTRSALRSVPSLPVPERASWPTVSLIIPARDEAGELEAALRARLAEGYPALEVVLVDDRSTDGTGEVARALAAADPRLTVTRVEALPEGWLGKVHALQRGLEASRGEWVLFSDADVALAPGTLRRLVGWAEAGQLDHVAALPSITPGGPGIALCLEAFFRFIVTFPRLWAVERADSKAAVGVGAFNLFRRRALERTPGLQALRMEIGDDMALGVMLKRAGAAQRVLVGREAISLRFYPSVAAAAGALEKNGALAPAGLQLAGLALLLGLELGWVAGLLWWWPAGLALAAFAAATGWGVASWLGNQRWPALLPGAGMVPLAAVLARSALLAWRRGGVRWRGTFYPTAEVRAGSRRWR